MSVGLEIRRWIGVPNPKPNHVGVDLHLGPDPDTVKFGRNDHWSVKVDMLLAALDELDRFENRKRLKDEKLEITIGVEDAGADRFINVRDVYSLALTPGELPGRVKIQENSMYGGAREVQREDLRYAIKHRGDLDR